MAIPTFPSSQALNTDNSPLNKKRRFVPNSMPVVRPDANADIENHTFGSPLLFQLCGQGPSQHELEAQLLQVGMRVRKSVNDGYQTSPSPKRPTSRLFFNGGKLSSDTQMGPAGQPVSTTTFCGIDHATVARITSSPTTPPRLWKYSTSNKRNLDIDSDSDDAEFLPITPKFASDTNLSIPTDCFSMDYEDVEQVSPCTRVRFSSQNNVLVTRVNGRRMAKPRSRIGKPLASTHDDEAMDENVFDWAEQNQSQKFGELRQQESEKITKWSPFKPKGVQWLGHRRLTSNNDFGEATFLQKREDVEMDCS